MSSMNNQKSMPWIDSSVSLLATTVSKYIRAITESCSLKEDLRESITLLCMCDNRTSTNAIYYVTHMPSKH